MGALAALTIAVGLACFLIPKMLAPKQDSVSTSNKQVDSASQYNLAYQSPLSAETIFNRNSPSVVQIVNHDIHGNTSTGSGFLVRKGLVATNLHCVDDSKSMYILQGDNKEVAVYDIVIQDKHPDLAIIRVGDNIKGKPLELSIGELPAVGTKVFAIGNPLGLSKTLSDGIVSGHREYYGITEIQITAPISPGSSGGPLFGADGKVIGVTTSTIRSGQNLNFAIPASHVIKLLNQCR